MAKLNQDLSYREIYKAIRKRRAIDFTANRNDLGFENIETEMPSLNFNFPVMLPELQSLRAAIDFLLRESTGAIIMQSIDKLRLLVKVFNGTIIYMKIGNGDEWRVIIAFQE